MSGRASRKKRKRSCIKSNPSELGGGSPQLRVNNISASVSFSQYNQVVVNDVFSTIAEVSRTNEPLAQEMFSMVKTMQSHVIDSDNKLSQMEKKEQDERHAHNRRMSYLFACGAFVRYFIAIGVIGVAVFLIVKGHFSEGCSLLLIGISLLFPKFLESLFRRFFG